MTETLRDLPDDHPGRESVVGTLRTQCDALVGLQDESGFWHHILDYPDSPLETSGTLQFAYTFSLAVELGVLDADPYLDAAERAFAACRGTVDGEGNVRRVAVPPGGPAAPLGVTSYGQGWFLLAAARLGSQDADR